MGTKKGAIILRITAILAFASCYTTGFESLDVLLYEGNPSGIMLALLSILALVAGIFGLVEAKNTSIPKVSLYAVLGYLPLALIGIVFAYGMDINSFWIILATAFILPFLVAALLRRFALSSGSTEPAFPKIAYKTRRDSVATLKCKNCGVNITAGSKFCNECGAVVEQEPSKNICNNCGAEMPPEAKRCGMCGENL